MWTNIYTHPRVEGEFAGKSWPTKDEADTAAAWELEHEPETKLVRQEEHSEWR